MRFPRYRPSAPAPAPEECARETCSCPECVGCCDCSACRALRQDDVGAELDHETA